MLPRSALATSAEIHAEDEARSQWATPENGTGPVTSCWGPTHTALVEEEENLLKDGE